MTLLQANGGLQCQCPGLPSSFKFSGTLFFFAYASRLQTYMNSGLLRGLLLLSFGTLFMTAFHIGIFAELAHHRWFGLWHILIAMKPWAQLLGCNEFPNACAIQYAQEEDFPKTPNDRGSWHSKGTTSHCVSPVKALTLKDVSLLREKVNCMQLIWWSITPQHIFSCC